jgi:hypothetical protein
MKDGGDDIFSTRESRCRITGFWWPQKQCRAQHLSEWVRAVSSEDFGGSSGEGILGEDERLDFHIVLVRRLRKHG